MVLTQKNRTCKRCDGKIPKEKRGSSHCPKCLIYYYKKSGLDYSHLEKYINDDL